MQYDACAEHFGRADLVYNQAEQAMAEDDNEWGGRNVPEGAI